MQELELTMQGGLCARRGIIVGYYGINSGGWGSLAHYPEGFTVINGLFKPFLLSLFKAIYIP